ncbi:unnamed protein product [Ophioblennius macclurei]
MATSQVKDFLVTYLMPEKCYGEIFVQFHFHVPCLQFILNRIASLWIILDTFLAQLPQLLKILWRGNAEGISLFSVLLQLYAFSCPVVYAVVNKFPLFAWVERVFMLVQTATIVFLILYHRGEVLKGLLFLVGFGGVMFLLSAYAPVAIISVMQDSNLAALIASKALQALTNYNNGHTGQLSTVSVFLTCAGSLSAAFVSLQESIYSLTSLSTALSASLSCVLLVQVICSRSIFVTDAKKKE